MTSLNADATFYQKKILITGGTGSLGQRLVEILRTEHQPSRIIIFSRDEVKQYQMQKRWPQDPAELRYFIGDIRDKGRLLKAFKNVDIIIHAAAMKQVPACEYNPMEAVKTNIFGAQNIVEAALECGVNKVLVVSSDKAADPVNLYGATKLCMEKVFVASNVFSRPRVGPNFSLTRYGNVLGSRGSVLLAFLEQKKRDGKLRLTDPRMTRFWITVDDAARFVLSCVKHMEGGEIYVPKMPSASVQMLALLLANGCPIDVVGIRPGEKIHEVVISHNEAHRTYDSGDYYVILPDIRFFEREWRYDYTKELGQTYSSETNEWQMTEQQMKKMVDKVYATDSVFAFEQKSWPTVG